MKLEELKSAYDNTTPATKLEKPGLWSVEPGDATHYTVDVEVSGRVAMAFVGTDVQFEAERQRVAVVLDGRVVTKPRGNNQYQVDILIYLAMLALDIDYPEPDGLAERRRLNNKKED